MGSSSRRQQERALKRNDIVDAAERVFFSRGFDHASMDEVAKEAEFSKRTVYIYFNSKRQIYLEIMIRGYRLLLGMIENSFSNSRPANAADELWNIFFTCMAFSRDHPEYFTAIMEYETGNTADPPGTHDESEEECYRLGELVFGYLDRALRRGVKEGTFRSDLDVNQAALTLWACTVGVYATARNKGGYLKHYHGVEPDEFISDSFRLVMRLISRDGRDQNNGKGD